jgi:transcriptional regulator with XRE-family HTH domain
MPRARVVDENMKVKVIELRLKGYSYREIARELGISVSTAFKLVKGSNADKAPKSVQAISIDSEATDLGKILRGVALLTLLEIHNTKRIDEIEELIKWIKMSAALRLIGDFRCMWIDANGYCKAWILREERVNVVENPLLCVACPLYTPLYILKRRS